MKNIFQGLIQTDRGYSSGRLGFLVTVGLSNVIIWPIIAFLTLYHGKFPAIPEGVVYLYAAAQGIAFGGKAAQSFADRGKDDRKSKKPA